MPATGPYRAHLMIAGSMLSAGAWAGLAGLLARVAELLGESEPAGEVLTTTRC